MHTQAPSYLRKHTVQHCLQLSSEFLEAAESVTPQKARGCLLRWQLSTILPLCRPANRPLQCPVPSAYSVRRPPAA